MNGCTEGARPGGSDQGMEPQPHRRGWVQPDVNATPGMPSGSIPSRRRSQIYCDSSSTTPAPPQPGWHHQHQLHQPEHLVQTKPDRPRHLRLPQRPDQHRVYPAGAPVPSAGVAAATSNLNVLNVAPSDSWGRQVTAGVVPAAALQHVSPAALLFARAAQLRLSSPHKRRRQRETEEESTAAGFCAALRRHPPPMPAALQHRLAAPQQSALGKVRVLLRLKQAEPVPHFSVDARRKQVTLLAPSPTPSASAHPESRRIAVAAPKMFAFDGVYSWDDPQSEICRSALVDVVHAVINGNDGCILCFGQAKTGKTRTMLGSADSAEQLGIIPSAISWLYAGIAEQKQRSGARFSVRVSAVQIAGPSETLRDLLKHHAKDCDQSPGVYLREDPVLGSQLQNQSEIRAETPEKAAHFLDGAASARAASEDGGRSSHLLYTLHLFQYSVKNDKSSGVTGGRSRLHLFDLGSFEKTKVSGLTLSAVGNVIVSIFNAHKHLPCRDSKLVHLLREAMSSLTCQTTIVAHVNTEAALYAETLTTVQLASRIHRMRRRRVKPHGSSGSGGSAEEAGGRMRSSGEESSGRSSSDIEPSSSEQSADTVIYLGPGADECTDGEHPPVYIPNINGDHSAALSKVLKNSMSEGGKSRSPARNVPSNGSTPTHRNSNGSTPTHRNANGQPYSPQHRNSDKLTGAVPKSPQVKRKAGGAASAAEKPSAGQEQWIDGPRISRSRLAEAYSSKQRQETWVDGPVGPPPAGHMAGHAASTPAPATAPQHHPALVKPASRSAALGLQQLQYGFMDDHKKTMIARWVEHQIEAVTCENRTERRESPPRRPHQYRQLTQFKTQEQEEEPATKMITQFKTQNSSGENSPVPERSTRTTSGHRKPEPAAQQAEKRPPQVEKEPSPPRQAEAESTTSPPLAPAPTLDEICAQCEHLVDVLSQEGDSAAERADGSTEQSPDGAQIASAQNNNEEGDSGSEKHASSSSSSDVARGEIIEVEERDEPVPMTDLCLQVTEEDIALCMGFTIKKPPQPLQLDMDGHPLHALSEENLTTASSFSDMYTLRGGSDCEPAGEKPLDCPPLGLLDIPDYGRLCDDLSLTNQRLDGISRLHDFYRELASQPTAAPPTPLISDLLLTSTCGERSDSASICSEPGRPLACQNCNTLKKTDTLKHGNYVKSIKDWLALLPDLESEGEEYICDACRRKRQDELDQIGDGDDFEIQSDITPYLPTFSNLASLRHPDGASNPNLSKPVVVSEVPVDVPLDERVPGNGASGSDEDASSCRQEPTTVANATEASPIPKQRPVENSEVTSCDQRQETPGQDDSQANPPPAPPAAPVEKPSKQSRLSRLLGGGRSSSRSPAQVASSRHSRHEVSGSIYSPRYPERTLSKSSKNSKKNSAADSRKSKSKERSERKMTNSSSDAKREHPDRMPSLISASPAQKPPASQPQQSWSPALRPEKYTFTCDTTLPAFLPAVSSGYDSGNDSGIGLRHPQRRWRGVPVGGREAALHTSECSSIESSQESEDEPRQRRRHGQVQAGSPARRVSGVRSDPDPRHQISQPPPPNHGLREQIAAKTAAKKTWASGMPVISRLFQRKAKPPVACRGPGPGAPAAGTAAP